MKRIKDRSINLDLKNLRNIPVLRTELSEEEREGEKIVGFGFFRNSNYRM